MSDHAPRTRDRTWTWDEVVRESAARAELRPRPTFGDQVMAAVEVRRGVRLNQDLDLSGFRASQEDLGTKGAPRFVRVTHALPATGSGKIRKKEPQVEGWQCDDPVYRWAGRGAPSYSLMTSEDKDVLREEFRRAGRERFLPGVFS